MRDARNKPFLIYLLVLAIALLANLTGGCSKEQGSNTTSDIPDSLSVTEIILNPKSPSLGDTLTATAVVKGNSTSGDYVMYSWTASTGMFVEDNKAVVRWVAPSTSAPAQITVKAENSVKSSMLTTSVFVSNVQTQIPNSGGELRLSPAGTSLISQFSPQPPGAGTFAGWGIRINNLTGAGGQNTVLPATLNASSIRFSRQMDLASFNTFQLTGLINLNIINMSSKAITTLPNTIFNQRPPAYLDADISPNSQLMTYAVWWPDQLMPPTQGGVDTFAVAVWNIAQGTESRVAMIGDNYCPSFSTNGDYLCWVSTRNGDLDYYATPVSGTTIAPDTVTPPSQITDGIKFNCDRVGSLDQAWSPIANLLAVLDDSGAMWLVNPDGSGATEVVLAGSVREFSWTRSGSFIVASTGRTLYRIDTGGGATLIYDAPSGDRLSRLAVSSNDELLIYQVLRAGSTWYEVVDLSGVTGIDGPLKVTAAASPGNSALYEPLFSLAPVWLPGQPEVRALLFNGTSTPRISKMNFGSLYPAP